MSAPSVTLVRHIKAPPRKLYEAWTDPKLLAQWWTPRSVAIKSVVAENRSGGAWRIAIRGADGRDTEVGGTYEELDPPRKLVFTWGWDGEPPTRVTVALKAVEGGTELTLTHEGAASAAIAAGRREGWTKSLWRLEREFG